MEIGSIIEAMNHPQMRHAAMVHMPIVLSIVAAVLALLSALWMGKNKTLRWLALATCVVLIGAAWFARQSGEDAEGVLDGTFAAAADVAALIEEHEHMAENVWMMAIACAALVGLSAVRKKAVQLTFAWLAVGMTGFTAGWIGVTAHHGGQLVYEHGAGAPDNSTYVATGDGESSHDDDGDEHDDDDDAPASDGDDGAPAAAVDARLVHFRANVKPVLEQQCIKCHNPTRKRRSGELDQTSIESLLQGGWSGPAVIPGNPDESWLIIAVRHEQDMEMPPNKDRLSDEVIEALAQWIRDGAVWEPLGPPPPREEDGEESAGS